MEPGKTIKRVDTKTLNRWTIEYEDGSKTLVFARPIEDGPFKGLAKLESLDVAPKAS